MGVEKPVRGRNRVTMAEIAREAGVSLSTVSFVLSNRPSRIAISHGTRQRVRKAARDLGYRLNVAARSLATGRSYSVLVAMIGEQWWEHILHRGVVEQMLPLGYTAYAAALNLEQETERAMEPCLDIILSGRADGVILVGAVGPESYGILGQLKEAADTMGVPVVALGNVIPAEYATAVCSIDDVSGGYQATRHLMEHGHTRIALITVAGPPWSTWREEGYRKAFADAGVRVDPGLVLRLQRHSQDEAYAAVIELAGTKDFTAVLVVSDILAVAVLSALKAAGRRVPDDCAVVGYDDNAMWARFTNPPLTTVANPFFESGKALAAVLLSLMDQTPMEPTLLPVSLVIRESCGCPKQR